MNFLDSESRGQVGTVSGFWGCWCQEREKEDREAPGGNGCGRFGVGSGFGLGKDRNLVGPDLDSSQGEKCRSLQVDPRKEGG